MLLDDDEFNCELCETELFLGQRGVCNDLNETCTCPAGYSGKDDWFTYNSRCHVNEHIQFSLQLFALLVSIAGLIVCLYVLADLTTRWHDTLFGTIKDEGFIRPSSRPRLVSNDSLKMSSDLRDDPEDTTRTLDKKVKFFELSDVRRKASYTAIVSYAFGCLVYVCYSAFQLAGVSRGPGKPYMDLVTMLTLTNILNGLYAWFYASYMTLPNLNRYGRVLGVKIVLVMNPKLIPKIIMCIVVIYNALYLIFAVVQIFYEAGRRVVDVMQLAVYPFIILPALLLEVFFVFEVEKLLKRTKQVLGEDASKVEGGTIQAITETLSAAKWLRLNQFISTVGITIIVIVSVSLGARYEYFFFNISIACGALVMAGTSLLLQKFTDGGLFLMMHTQNNNNSRSAKSKSLPASSRMIPVNTDSGVRESL